MSVIKRTTARTIPFALTPLAITLASVTKDTPAMARHYAQVGTTCDFFQRFSGCSIKSHKSLGSGGAGLR